MRLTLPGVAIAIAILAGCGSGARAAGPTGSERRAIAADLRAIGRVCAGPSSGSASAAGLDRAARQLAAFYRRYPTQAFQLPQVGGGEEAHMLSVLLVAHSELRGCSRAAERLIDAALPAKIRRSLDR